MVRGKRANTTLLKPRTKRKQTVAELEESQERFRKMFNSVSDAISVIDLNGIITETNQRTVEMHGLTSKEELLGRSALELVAPRDHKRIAANMQRAIKQGTVRDVEYTLLKADGTEFPGELSTSILKDASGKWIGHITIARDITERKQAEEALQAERNKLESLIGAMEYTLTIQDRDYNIIYQNELSRIASGGDHLGEKCYRAYEHRDKVCNGCPVEKAFKDGKSHTAERQTVPPSGEVAFWENTASPIRDARGEIVSCLELARDITERKQAEKALADEVTRRRILVDQSLDGIVVLDEEARVVEANQRFAEMLGYSPEEVRKLHTWDWDKNFPPEKLLEMGRAVDEKGLHLETRHHRKDGSVIDVDISINGTVVAGQKLIFCVCRDITERKRAEKALEESQKFSSSLLESSPNPISVFNPDLSIRYVNPAFEKLTGFTLTEIAGMKAPFPWWPEGKSEQIIAGLKNSMEHGGRRSGTEWNFRKKNGERIWLTVKSAPVIQEGKPVYLVINWLDITERKQAEEELKAAQERLIRSEKLAAIGQLAGGVGHELRNPLSAIKTAAQYTRKKLAASELAASEPKALEFLGLIDEEVDRANKVITDLLSFSRVAKPTVSPVKVESIIRDALGHVAVPENATVVTDVSPELPMVMVDAGQIQQVFVNVILNALEAMPEGGRLEIRANSKDDFVTVECTDTGSGIPEAVVGKIFEPLFTTKAKGIGLGLAMSKNIMERHGGDIGVQSKDGEGTTFTISLPTRAA
jgi:PAS domain S-box-containing protein